jgi:hypothetical protein
MPQFRIGTDDFKELIGEGGYFVDKSLLIREVIDGSKVTLLPRPRRFGKTLNMTMLRYFFEKTEDNTASLFEGLEISHHPEYLKHQGQYPVIYITLKQIKGENFFEIDLQLRKLVSQLYTLHKPAAKILDNELTRSDFADLCNGTSTNAALKNSLRDLITTLYQYHKKPVIVLIDEYDSPLIESWTNGYYDEMTTFMRSWLGGGLKHDTASALYRAVVTGILRVAKESIFSELNNLKVCTTLLPNTLSQMFGFTEEEIQKILIDFNLLDHASTIREWYNGYSFGTKTIYNPWSVTNYIDNLPAPPGPHWLNTSSNALIYEELQAGGLEIEKDLQSLLSSVELRYPINETITFRDIGKSPANIWSFLYFSGYLKVETPQWADYDNSLLTYALSIPNQEIAAAYKQFVNQMFGTGNQALGIKSFLSIFLENKSSICLEEALQDLVLGLVSMYDIARLPEAVFHAFILGLLANLRSVYEIRSNIESGYGRADILMIPKTTKYPIGYVIEFKSIDPKKEPNKSADSALVQIQRKEYIAALHNAGVSPDQVRTLAIILQGKKIVVRGIPAV